MKNNSFIKLLCFSLCFQLAILPKLAYGDASLSDYDSTCSSILSQSAASTTNSEKLSYCQAAQTAKQAAVTSGVLWKVWGLVAATCAAICVASAGGIADPIVSGACVAANVAATGVEAVETKDYMSALINLGFTLGPAVLLGGPEKKTPQEGEAKKPAEIDKESCFAAAYAAYQAYTDYQSMTSSQNSEISSLTQAQAVVSQAAAAATTTTSANDTTSTANAMTTQAQNSSSGTSGSVSSLNSVPPSCAASGSSNTVGLMVACAVASDTTLPTALTTGNVPQDFNTVTGGNFENSLTGAQNPGQQLASAFGGGGDGSGGILSTEGQAGIVSAFQDLGSALESGSLSGSSYAGGGGGGGRRSSGSAEEDPLLALMAGLLGGLQGNKSENSSQIGLAQVIFANQKKSATAVAEDRKLSIFDRIAYRYHYVALQFFGPPPKKQLSPSPIRRL